MGKKIYEQNDAIQSQKPIVQQFFTRKAPSQEEQQSRAKQGYNWDGKNWRFVGTISSTGGKPSTDNRTSAERNRDYWNFWKGSTDRWNTSWDNGTNPVKGALDNGLGYTNPVTAVANTAYDIYNAYDQLSSPQGLAKTWGLFKQGNLGKAAVSAVGDALAVSDLVPGMPETPNVRPRTPQFSTPVDMTTIRRFEANQPRIVEEGSTFEDRLQHLINNATNDHDRRVLQQIAEGNYTNIGYLSGRQYSGLIDLHPDSRFLNTAGPYARVRQLQAIQQLRQHTDGDPLPSGEVLEIALGNNPYNDNPLLQELSEEFTNSYNILPAVTREMFEQPWNPANNHIIEAMLRNNYLVDDYNHPYNVLRNRFLSHRDMPLEYRHIDTNIYDGSYPIQYYTGTDTPEKFKDPQQLLQYGLLGDTPGLFSNDELSNLSQEAFDKMAMRSGKLGVEGAHIANGWDGTPETVLKALLSKGSESNSIIRGTNNSQRAGYVNTPHSLSIDSWPIWELQSLRQLDKTNIIPVSLLQNNRDFKHRYRIVDGVPYGVTNLYGLHNRTEVSPELSAFIRKNKGKLTLNDFSMDSSDGINFNVSHNGNNVGTFKMLNEQETLDKFNTIRRRLYRSNPELYPGDAMHFSGYNFAVPFIPTQLKKQGGKINDRSIKKVVRKD